MKRNDLDRIKRATRHREGDWEIDVAEDANGRLILVSAQRELPNGKMELLTVEDGEVVSSTIDMPFNEFAVAKANLRESVAEAFRPTIRRLEGWFRR